MSKPHDEYSTDEPPPSYHEAINTGSSVAPPMPQRPVAETFNSQGPPPGPPPPPQRYSNPPPQPPRQSSSSAASLYNNNPNLPFEFPKNFLCLKCKNTGWKVKNGKICTACWKRFYLKNNAYNPNAKLPYKYPKGVICEKCENTGYKKKNGERCYDCWDWYNRKVPPKQTGPIKLRPGDPRIGGQLCLRCRGSGIVSVFLFEEDYCPTCNGLGRIFTGPPPGPPQGGFYGPPPGQFPPGQYPPQGHPPQGYPPQGPPGHYPPQGKQQGYYKY